MAMTIETMMKTGADLPLLGFGASWKLGGVEISHADLLTALRDAGFADHAPRSVPPDKRAVKRAIRAWASARTGRAGEALLADETDAGGDRVRQSDLIRIINDGDSEYVTYALVAEHADVREIALQYATDVRFFLKKKTGELFVSTEASGAVQAQAAAEADRIAAEIAPLWDKHRELHLSGDVGRIVTAIAKSLDAVTLRDGGGYYFVPLGQRPALDRLRTFVANLPATGSQKPIVLAFPIVNGEEAQAMLREAAAEDFMREIEAAETDLQRFLEGREGSVKANTVQARIGAYARLRAKAAVYTDSIGMRQERLLVGLDVLEAQAQALLPASTVRGARADAAVGELPVLPVSEGVRGRRQDAA